jgi:hypothetical protein
MLSGATTSPVVPVVVEIAESGLSTIQGSALEGVAGAISGGITLLGGGGGLLLCLVGGESGVAAGLDFLWQKLLGLVGLGGGLGGGLGPGHGET